MQKTLKKRPTLSKPRSKGSGKMSLKTNPIGIYEKALPDAFTWETKLKVAKAAGFNYLEISIDESDERLARLDWDDSEIKLINALVDKHDLPIVSMCLSGHRRFPFGSHDEEVRNKAHSIMKKALELAEKLHIRNIQLAGYDVYYEKSDESTIHRFREGLKASASMAEAKNIMLSIEIMDTKLIGTITRGLAFIDPISSPYLKLYPDLGNLSRWAKVPAQELFIGRKAMVAIHLKDTRPGEFKRVPFGEGTVDFPTLFKKLDTLEYNGPFVIEMWADNTQEETENACIKRLIKTRSWLKERMS